MNNLRTYHSLINKRNTIAEELSNVTDRLLFECCEQSIVSRVLRIKENELTKKYNAICADLKEVMKTVEVRQYIKEENKKQKAEVERLCCL